MNLEALRKSKEVDGLITLLTVKKKTSLKRRKKRKR